MNIPTESLTGRLLIAMPHIGDPRFERAVILICAHNSDHAMGIVINEVMDDLRLPELLDQLGVDGEQANDAPILAGGPVGTDRGFVLHSDDYDTPGVTLNVTEGVCMTASLDILDAMAGNDQPERAILALGYSGWGAGQIEQEIAGNVWLTADADAQIVFDNAYETKWSRALARIGVSPEMLQADSGRA